MLGTSVAKIVGVASANTWIILFFTSLGLVRVSKFINVARGVIFLLKEKIISMIPSRRNKFKNESIYSLRSWEEFEEYTAYCLGDKPGMKAYTAKELKKKNKLPKAIQKCKGDGGVDVVAFKKSKHGPDQVHIVQCKFYQAGNNVGAPDVNKLFGTARFFQKYYPKHEIVPVILTTSRYTKEAISQSEGVYLYDIDGLYDYLGS